MTNPGKAFGGEAGDRAPKCPFTLTALNDIDPFAAYEDARRTGNLVWDEGMKAWLVLDYANCVFVETNESEFPNPYASAPALVVKVKGGRSNITLTQGEEHERLRRFHLQLLSPKAVEAYRQHQIRPIIKFLIDRIVHKGEAELAHDISDQLPPRVIANLFAMPWQDDGLIARILHCHEEIMLWIGRKHSGEELTARAIAASDELNAMLLPYIRLRRDKPADDFISRVWQEAPEYYGPMSEADALGICREIFLGGSDTTVHGISNSLYLLLTDAGLRAAIAKDRQTAVNGLVEEAMRLYGSVQYRFRLAAHGCRLGEADVKAGDTLILLHAAANRDPAHYACPALADLSRRPIADHLAFNKGPRTCVGAGLARAEMRETIHAVLERLPNLRLDPGKEPPCYQSLFMRSFRPLHVTFET